MSFQFGFGKMLVVGIWLVERETILLRDMFGNCPCVVLRGPVPQFLSLISLLCPVY